MNFPIVPTNKEDILIYLQELSTILEELNRPELQGFMLEEWNYEPDNLRDKMVVYADGTNWNPGSGAGIYRYVATTDTWVSIG